MTVMATCSVVIVILAPLFGSARNAGVDSPESRLVTVPEDQGYPDEWSTTLEDARARVQFEILLPDHPFANESNITAVYVYSDDAAVAIQFPSPSEPSAPLRQEYLEVWESAWTSGDPLENFEEDLRESPAEGKSILDLGGVPALGVTARSSSDVDRANPAFLRFEIDGTDVQISGGESLDVLIEIGRSLIASVHHPPRLPHLVLSSPFGM
jgi:hypothetical protein